MPDHPWSLWGISASILPDMMSPGGGNIQLRRMFLGKQDLSSYPGMRPDHLHLLIGQMPLFKQDLMGNFSFSHIVQQPRSPQGQQQIPVPPEGPGHKDGKRRNPHRVADGVTVVIRVMDILHHIGEPCFCKVQQIFADAAGLIHVDGASGGHTGMGS